MKPSSLIEFVRLLRGKNWNKIKIHREFRKRVNKTDYEEDAVEKLMIHFSKMTAL